MSAAGRVDEVDVNRVEDEEDSVGEVELGVEAVEEVCALVDAFKAVANDRPSSNGQHR
jgi:hypothetical protein